MITLAQLQQIIPGAGKRAEMFIIPLIRAMNDFDIDRPARRAAFLAQIAHESGSLRYTLEIANGTAYNRRADLGNTRPDAIEIAATHGLTPGPMWRGRGLIQITGYDNYRACSLALYQDAEHLVHHPELLELPDAASRSAAWFWSCRRCNELADAGKFESITRKINGGLNGQAERVALWQRARLVLGC